MTHATVSAERGREDLALTFAEVGVGIEGKDLNGQVDVRGAYPTAGDTEFPVQLGQAFGGYSNDFFGVSAGLQNTLAGYEPVNPAQYPFITRSYLYTNGPVSDLGGRIRLGPEFVSLIGGIYTSNFGFLGDNNRAPAGLIGFHLSLKKFSLVMNGLVGPEQDNNNKDIRFMGDLVLSVTPHEMLELGLNFDYAQDKQDEKQKHWEGGAVYLTLTPRQWIQWANRVEMFHDPEGTITGQENLFALGVTTALNFRLIRPPQQLDFRLEYSLLHDVDGNATINGRRNANLFSASLVYQFGINRKLKGKED